jgi:hypothetical protein
MSKQSLLNPKAENLFALEGNAAVLHGQDLGVCVVIHGYMDTWVRDRRHRFASRAHLVHLRPFSNDSATCPRPGFRELFLPRTLIRQHQYR